MLCSGNLVNLGRFQLVNYCDWISIVANAHLKGISGNSLVASLAIINSALYPDTDAAPLPDFRFICSSPS